MHSSSLNHQYRLVWSDATQSFVAVAENTKGRGKQSRSGRAARLVSALMVSGALSAAAAGDLPTGDIFDTCLRNSVLGFRPIEHQCGWALDYQGLTTSLDDFQCQLSLQ